MGLAIKTDLQVLIPVVVELGRLVADHRAQLLELVLSFPEALTCDKKRLLLFNELLFTACFKSTRTN
jgi:hypothetical protein